MAKIPHPGKGIPRAQWPSKDDPKWVAYRAQLKASGFGKKGTKAKSFIKDPDLTPVEQTKADYDPGMVRESLQPPKSTTVNFPNNKVNVPQPEYEFSPENIPPNLFSGDQKHLEVMGLNGSTTDPMPGFKLYWFDAKNGVRIAMAQRSGYTFVEKNEVLLNEGLEGSDDLGTHVRKIGNIFGGETDDGKPQYMYLMKKPMWLVDKHNVQMEAVNRKYEEIIRTGKISQNAADRQFAAGSDIAVQERSKLPAINIRETLNRSN